MVLYEHRFDNPLSKPVGSLESAVGDLHAHGLCQWSADRAIIVSPILSAACRDIGVG
jgi:hypothetical protein